MSPHKRIFIFIVSIVSLVFVSNAQLGYFSVVTNAYCGCNGSASVTITSGISPYSYTLNGTPTSTNVFTGLCPGNYTLFVEDSNAPTPDTVTIFFTVLDSIFKDTIIAKDGCNTMASASITLTGGVSPYSYTILPLGTPQTLTLNNLSTGTYTFLATDNAGCSLTNTFAVNNYSAVANFSMSATNAKVGSTIQFTNLSQYASSFLWDFGNGNQSGSYDAAITYTAQGSYLVKLIASLATCTDTAYRFLFITNELWISIPNVFTPNDDGVNDLWMISFMGSVDMKLQIFNRNGIKLYENKGTGIQWDGRTLSGEPVPTGTYFYVLEVTDVNNVVQKFNGYITLIR
ncbi:MAG: hypothetical protein KatS3mg027_0670 [Bacteroidia bacterium]|nr:MAG: hypothetical protein KatS3mg027_0670 [Bacteroidia bacterium]